VAAATAAAPAWWCRFSCVLLSLLQWRCSGLGALLVLMLQRSASQFKFVVAQGADLQWKAVLVVAAAGFAPAFS